MRCHPYTILFIVILLTFLQIFGQSSQGFALEDDLPFRQFIAIFKFSHYCSTRFEIYLKEEFLNGHKFSKKPYIFFKEKLTLKL